MKLGPPKENHKQKNANKPQKKNTINPVSQTTSALSNHPTNQTNQQNSSNDDDYNDIYRDIKNPASYSSNVKAFISQKESLSLHRRKIRNFKRRKIVVTGPFHSISYDLIDYSMYSGFNGGYKFVLCAIDMFSRFSYAEPLRNKKAENVAAKIDKIIQSMQFVPKFFTSDKGYILALSCLLLNLSYF